MGDSASESLSEKFEPGDQFNRNSERVPVELPFWLLHHKDGQVVLEPYPWDEQ